MNRTTLALVMGAFVLASTLPSCMRRSPVVVADDYDSETIVDIMNEESPSIDISRNKGAHVSRPASDKKQNARTPLDGRWTIVAVGGQQIDTDDEMPYIIFTDKNDRFYASNGCNVINGMYTCDGRTVKFMSTLTTLALCPEEYSDQISAVLRDGVSIHFDTEHRGQETYLYFTDAQGAKLMTMVAHNMDVLNGQWLVTGIDGEAVDDPGMNLFLDIPQQTIHGNTGCNYFNGSITIDPFVSASISFSGMAVSMKACPNTDLERRMMVALESTTNYKYDNDTLTLTDSSGASLMTLRRDARY